MVASPRRPARWAFVKLWDDITLNRYGVQDPKHRRLQYGVQVNSLGLTEAPENNVQRIVLEMLGDAVEERPRPRRRTAAGGLNEALGLPRPWDQQWSPRMQQVLAFESDLLEYDDIFDGSHVIEAAWPSWSRGALAEIDRVQAMGGAVAAVESGYLKQALVASHAERRRRIESGEQVVVGVNAIEHRAVAAHRGPGDRRSRPLTPAAESAATESLPKRWRSERVETEVAVAWTRCGRPTPAT